MSPFDSFCISLTPLASAIKDQPLPCFPRTLIPRQLWTPEPEERTPAMKRVVQQLDLSSDLAEYVFKANSVQIQVGLASEDQPVLPLVRIRESRVFNSGKIAMCNCQRSKCLKLYCDCFSAGSYCSGCNCKKCMNRPEHEPVRKAAYQAALEKNPQAFQSKIERAHLDSVPRGCHCKRSACLKRYCECFQNQVKCSESCKCEGCKNS